MKRNIILAVLLTAAVAFSCTTKEEASKSLISDGSIAYTPKAIIEPFILDGPATKTVATFSDAGASFSFTTDDILGVFPYEPQSGDQVRFLAKEADANWATFDGQGFGLKNGQNYAAYYPGDWHNAQAEMVTQIPVDYTNQVQSEADVYNVGPADYLVANGIQPAGGVCAFNMKHVGALVVIDVKFPEAGTYTELSLNLDGYQSFTTTGTMDLTASNIAVVPETKAKKVTLFLGDAVNGISVTKGQTVRFYMMVAPVDLTSPVVSDITLKLVDDNNNALEGTLAAKNFQAGKAYKYSYKFAGPAPTEPTNLSAAGTANTYIVDVDEVNALGYYFDATKAGNGETSTNTYFNTLSFPASICYPASGDISGAGVKSIWIENNCITDLAYDSENNTITFKATGNKGNAKVTLTSAADGAGDGVWTWLIWCTDAPQAITYTNTTTNFTFNVLDRNLGATTAQPSTDLHAQNGFYYQFGNPIPYTKAEFASADAGIWRMTDALALNPQKPFANGDFFWFNPWGGGTYAKQWFGILWGGWSTALATTWGNFTTFHNANIAKTKYDPCPVGYQVAPYSFFNGLALGDGANGLGRYVSGTNNELYFPCNGCVDSNPNATPGAYMWDPDEPNYYIFMWTLNHNNSNLSYHFLGGRGGTPEMTTNMVGRGMAVRCVAEQ